MATKPEGGTAVVDDEVRSYWVGLDSRCPFESVTCGGIEFSKRTEKVERRENTTQRSERPGRVVELRPSQVKRIKEKAAIKLVRPGARPTIHNTTSPGYERSSVDKPLNRFIYLVELSDPGARTEMSPPGGTGF